VQGFLIEDEQTLAQLRQICRKVTVDLRRSAVNDADYAPPPRELAPEDEPKVGRVSSAPPAPRKRRRSLFPVWLREMFAGRGYTEPEAPEKPALTPLLTRDSQTSPAKRANRVAVRKFDDVAPAVTTPEPRQGITLGPRKDLLAWLREQ